MAVTLRGQHPTTAPYITSPEHGDDRVGHFHPNILNRFSELTTTELPVKEGKQFVPVVIILSLSVFQHLNDASLAIDSLYFATSFAIDLIVPRAQNGDG